MSRSQLRPAAVADVRLEPLLDSCEELAKRWLLELIDGRPLRRAGEVSVARFVDDAPELCARVVRSLASDEELDRLRTFGAAGGRDDRVDIAEMLGASSPSAIVEAIDALRTLLWEAIVETFSSDLGAGTAGRLADRLAHACSLLAAGALRAESAPAGDRAPRIEMQEGAAELSEQPAIEDPWAIDPPPDTADSAWLADVAPKLEHGGDAGGPFAVLLIELPDAARLREATEAHELDELIGAVQGALRGSLGLSERLAAEGMGRWWLVAPGLRAQEGVSLAERLAAAANAAVAHRRVPLTVAIGVAASPQDGHEGDELAEHAEESLYAALSAGVPVLSDGALGASGAATGPES